MYTYSWTLAIPHFLYPRSQTLRLLHGPRATFPLKTFLTTRLQATGSSSSSESLFSVSNTHLSLKAWLLDFHISRVLKMGWAQSHLGSFNQNSCAWSLSHWIFADSNIQYFWRWNVIMYHWNSSLSDSEAWNRLRNNSLVLLSVVITDPYILYAILYAMLYKLNLYAIL